MPPESPLNVAALALLVAVLGAALGAWLVTVAQRQLRGPLRFGRWVRAGAVSATALLFVGVVLRFGLQPVVPGYLVFAAAGVALSLVDLAEKRLPNALVLPAAGAVAALLVLAALFEARPIAALGVLVGAAGLFAVYLVLALLSRGQVGMGDVKFGLAAGAATGYFGLRVWLIGLVAGAVLNGVAAVVALLLGRTTYRGSVPFGPSIFVGSILAVTVFS